MVVVDALAELHGHRDSGFARGVDGAAHDLLVQAAAPGQGSAAAAPGHFRDRAAEVEVDVVGEVLVDDAADGLRDDVRVDAVELETPGRFVRIERDHLQRLRVALDQRDRGDHFADVDAGPEFAAEPAETGVGDPRHRCEDDRWPYLVPAERQRLRRHGREGGGR